jgi:hypothetical protein
MPGILLSMGACGNVFEDEAEDGVVGNLAAEGVDGGGDGVAAGMAGAGGEKDGVGLLSEDEGFSAGG